MYKVMGYLGIVVVACICVYAFFPQSNGFIKTEKFVGYDALIATASKKKKVELEDNDEKIVEDGETKKEKNINDKIDSLEFNRQVSDIINSFVYEIKAGKYEEAKKYLTNEQASDVKRSVMYALNYNSEYTFFKNYLMSYEVFINNVEETDQGAIVNIKIRRYDINTLQRRLLAKQYENIDEYKNSTYEDILFQNEEYFRTEFVKSNVPMKTDTYNVMLIKEDDGWKILNDDSLTDIIIDMEFQIDKENTKK